MNLSNTLYLAQSKWKAGERRAFSTSIAAKNGRVVPAFKIAPAGSFDPDEQRVLSTTEYLKSFGRQLAESCGRRLVFIDAELIDDEIHREAVGTHPLTELIERARLEGANAAPVLQLHSSSGYLAAVKRVSARDSAAISCLRLGLQELETVPDADTLKSFVVSLGLAPKHTVILIDGGPMAITAPEDVAQLIAAQVSRLIAPHTWSRVFWSATTLPEKPKLKRGMIGRFARSDWALYESILRIRDEFSVLPMFSDYMLEYPAFYKPANVSPTAKLFYSTETDYLQFIGETTRTGQKYGNIFPVAAQLANAPEFKGADFCVGDAYIDRLSSGTGKTGHASLWRWCASDHHLALVDRQLTSAFGIRPSQIEEPKTVQQLQLV